MLIRSSIITVSAASLVFLVSAYSQPAGKDPAQPAAPAVGAAAGHQQPSTAPASAAAIEALKKLSWLAGTWTGTMDGDPVDETWTAPSGDSLMGMFRWQSEGKTVLFELITIHAEGESPVMRIRHFDGGTEPWKNEAGGIAALTPEVMEQGHMLFKNGTEIGGLAACEYTLSAADELAVVVSFKQDRRPALRFTLKKAAR